MIIYLRMREYQLYMVTLGMELASKASIALQPYILRFKCVFRIIFTYGCCPYLFKTLNNFCSIITLDVEKKTQADH